MAKTATKRRAWTPEQLRTLKTMARKKTHAGRIAKILKRTEGATRQKAFSMGSALPASLRLVKQPASRCVDAPPCAGRFYLKSKNI